MELWRHISTFESARASCGKHFQGNCILINSKLLEHNIDELVNILLLERRQKNLQVSVNWLIKKKIITSRVTVHVYVYSPDHTPTPQPSSILQVY